MIILPHITHITNLHTKSLKVGGKDGLRDENALKSALGAVETAIGYTELTVPQASAMLLERIVKAHAFSDGNKRASALSFLLTLALNGWTYTGRQDSLALLVIETAQTGIFPDAALAQCSPSEVISFLFKYDTQEWVPGSQT
jgi:death-on-curing protein